MTCPACARRIRAALLHLTIQHRITPQRVGQIYAQLDTSKETTMHATLSPVLGDIGIEEEEWEVLPEWVPDEAPVETPAESPVPA